MRCNIGGVAGRHNFDVIVSGSSIGFSHKMLLSYTTKSVQRCHRPEKNCGLYQAHAQYCFIYVDFPLLSQERIAVQLQ